MISNKPVKIEQIYESEIAIFMLQNLLPKSLKIHVHEAKYYNSLLLRKKEFSTINNILYRTKNVE